MRILVVSLNFHPEPTGIGKYSGELAAYLADQGYMVRVITAPPYYPHWRVQPGYHSWQYRKENWRGIEIQRCPLWVPRQPSGLTRLVYLTSFALSSLPVLISQIKWKPSLVLCIAPALSNAPFVLAFAYISRAKAWLHIQDFELEAAIKLGILPGGNGLNGLAASLERALFSQFTYISTISERMLAHLNKKQLPLDKISLFPNWVDTNQIFPLDNELNLLRRSLCLAPERIVVLYAGALGKKQGLEHLLVVAANMRQHSQLQFIICGDGANREQLEFDARDLPNVLFLPVQPAAKLNELLNMADIHVLLQRADIADLVMPSKLSGMFASGKAVIATARPDTELGEVVREVGCLVPPEDPDALAEAILQLSESAERRAELGQAGREYAIKNWDASVILRRFDQRLRQIVEDN